MNWVKGGISKQLAIELGEWVKNSGKEGRTGWMMWKLDGRFKTRQQCYL